MFDQRKRKKLEKHRNDTLSVICGERLGFEQMLQRVRITGASPDVALVDEVLRRLAEIKQKADQETNIDELDSLIGDAEQQGQLRAYVCPRAEIRNEGILAIDLMEEWNVPRTVIDKLRRSFGQEVEKAGTDDAAARSALRTIFEEQDSWRRYTDDYEETMHRFTVLLFVATIILPLLAVLAFQWRLTFVVGVLSAGVAGSCVSVLAKLPMLDVSLSGELEAYRRRILSRIGVGVGGSLIGCALLGWGLLPISIQNQSFADALNACTVSPTTSCTGIRTLILLGVPMLFGFSERALTSFEQRVFGNSGQGQKGASRAGRK
ncbi:MAG TPA: hypothetical protein VMX16_18835 [Terriglobia bacterium]|nr:hypothetical protein [Terriglobia bacterium]